MRDIIFCGKRLDDGEWVEGSLLQCGENAYIFVGKGPDFPYDFRAHKVDPATVGQFSGLYDSTKWEDLTDAEKLDFYHQHYIGEDGMSVRFQCIDDVKPLWRGKRIFDGAIVKDHGGVIYPVVFTLTGFYLKYETPYSHVLYFDLLPLSNYWNAHGAIIEVIGNIHDNPELLEGGGEGG